MKPRLAASGLLRESFGRRPYKVQLVEREPGGIVSLAWGRPRSFEALGYAVRRPDRRRGWAWDDRALSLARAAAEDRHALWRMGQLRADVVAPVDLTLGAAWALFLDEDRGGLPASASARRNYRLSSREWTSHLGAGIAWNKITPADVEGVIRRVGKDTPAKAEMMAKNLRGLYLWLRRKRRMKELEDPLGEDFDWSALRAGLETRQERYTSAEVAKLLEVRDEIDPRFALMLVMAWETGARSAALRTWRRSMLDAPMTPPPTPEQAPHGWTVLPALKGQGEPVAFLTVFARAEIDKALLGYLAELEGEYQRSGRDYPMLPGARLGDKTRAVVGLSQSGAYRVIAESAVKDWLRDAEKRAGVRHVAHRGWHGVRRLWTDRVESVAGLDVAAVAGGWVDRTMVERIYRSKSQHDKLARARRALEGEP
jgi:integrase